MDIRAALRRHDKTLEKQLRKLEAELSGVRAAAAALGKSAGKQLRTDFQVNRAKAQLRSGAFQ